MLVIDREGRQLNGVRAEFASEVLVRLMTRGYEENELRDLVQRVANLQGDYNRFAQAALGAYIRELPQGVVNYDVLREGDDARG